MKTVWVPHRLSFHTGCFTQGSPGSVPMVGKSRVKVRVRVTNLVQLLFNLPVIVRSLPSLSRCSRGAVWAI